MQDSEVTFGTLANRLRTRWWLFLLVAAIPVLLGAYYLKTTVPVFRAERHVSIPVPPKGQAPVERKYARQSPGIPEAVSDADVFRGFMYSIDSTEFHMEFLEGRNSQNRGEEIALSELRSNLQVKTLGAQNGVIAFHGPVPSKVERTLDSLILTAQRFNDRKLQRTDQAEVEALKAEVAKAESYYRAKLKDRMAQMKEYESLLSTAALSGKVDLFGYLFTTPGRAELELLKSDLYLLQARLETPLPSKRIEVAGVLVRQIHPRKEFVIAAALLMGLILGSFAVLLPTPKSIATKFQSPLQVG